MRSAAPLCGKLVVRPECNLVRDLRGNADRRTQRGRRRPLAHAPVHPWRPFGATLSGQGPLTCRSLRVPRTDAGAPQPRGGEHRHVHTRWKSRTYNLTLALRSRSVSGRSPRARTASSSSLALTGGDSSVLTERNVSSPLKRSDSWIRGERRRPVDLSPPARGLRVNLPNPAASVPLVLVVSTLSAGDVIVPHVCRPCGRWRCIALVTVTTARSLAGVPSVPTSRHLGYSQDRVVARRRSSEIEARPFHAMSVLDLSGLVMTKAWTQMVPTVGAVSGRY